ncbi:hypothetical protein D1007_06102 [Hordeum vulgare]|nr:hypothetical protein D1007_06102 [Hordeum vulgare]
MAMGSGGVVIDGQRMDTQVVQPSNAFPACRSEGWEEKLSPNPHSSSQIAREGIPSASPAPPAAAPPPAVAPAPAPAPGLQPTVADAVAATHIGAKRRRAGLAPLPAASSAPAPATVPAPAPAPKKSRPKVSSRGPRGASSKVIGASPKRKKVAARKKPAAPPAAVAEPPPAANEVFEKMATPSSFMDLLQDTEVDLGAPPLEPFRVGGNGGA